MPIEKTRSPTSIQRVGEALSSFSERWMPDSMIIVWLLTFITIALVLALRLASPAQAVTAWGKGFWELLPTSMQICIMLLSGYVVARAPILTRWLKRLANLASPEKPAQAVLLVSLFSMLTAYVHWGLSLMGSSMLTVFVVRRVPKVDYRLLVASAYLGMGCTWHAGLTGTAPLWANTPDNPLMKRQILSYLIPQTETIFTPFNITLLIIVIVSVSALMYYLHSSDPRNQLSQERLDSLEIPELPKRPTTVSFAERMTWWPVFNIAIATLGAIWIASQARDAQNITQLFTFDNTNFLFLMLGLALHYRPIYFIKAVEEACRSVWGIIIQFPFYAGIFGLFTYTTLGERLALSFAALGTSQTFPLLTYWYVGILNYFVPSGGSEWLITSPYLVPAATKVGVPTELLILSFAWGNMMTDMIQPFFAIPLLSIAKVQFREIMGNLLLVFLLYFIITSVAFWLLPRL